MNADNDWKIAMKNGMTNLKNRMTILLIACMAAFLPSSAAADADIAAVFNLRHPVFDNFIHDFQRCCGLKVNRVHSEGMTPRGLADAVRATNPKLILAVGEESLEKLARIDDIPIIYSMSLESVAAGRTNVTGVNFNVDPRDQLRAIDSYLPGARRLGILYDPAQNEDFVQRVREAARSLKDKGFEIVARKVGRATDIGKLLVSMEGEIDAVWMIPDTEVLRDFNIRYIFRFGVERKKPVISCTEGYVSVGSVMAISFQMDAVGRQACKMAKRILAGGKAGDIPREYATGIIVRYNKGAAARMGYKPRPGAGSEIVASFINDKKTYGVIEK